MEYKNTSIFDHSPRGRFVLILVLMEYKNTPLLKEEQFLKMCLNPCSNGIQKYRAPAPSLTTKKRLNPCSNGIQKY